LGHEVLLQAALAVVLLLVGVVCLAKPCAAQRLERSAPLGVRSGGEPRISVLTFGPGDQTFSKFGHDALWVHDPQRPPKQRDLVYNYGTFRFDSPWLILDFLKGRLNYWLSVSTLDRTLASYRAANRSVTAQELALGSDQIEAITAFLIENAKPANASYRYDYYRDNCATRIRDVLDRHLDGALKAASGGPARLTYRDHTRRLTIDSPPLFFALDLALGPLIDRPISEWEEMFLPARVEAKLGQLTTAQGEPLVRRRISLFEARREPPLEAPPSFRWGWLFLGVAVGVGLYGASRVEQRWARASVATGLAVVSFVSGLLGCLLLVLWLLTDHEVTYWNQNVLLCPFWVIIVPILAPGFARARPRHSALMMRLMGAAVLTSLFALVSSAVLDQHTGPALSLFVPTWLGACAAVWTRVGRPWPRWLPSSSSPSVAVPPT
jgi:hypothetical protein